MIIDLILQGLSALVTPVIDLLPQGHLALPDPTSLAASLSGLDSLIPILGVLRLAAGMLSVLVLFVGFRALVFLRYLLLP